MSVLGVNASHTHQPQMFIPMTQVTPLLFAWVSNTDPTSRAKDAVYSPTCSLSGMSLLNSNRAL